MKFMLIDARLPLGDKKQEAYLDAELAKVLAGPQPTKPNDAARWPKPEIPSNVLLFSRA